MAIFQIVDGVLKNLYSNQLSSIRSLTSRILPEVVTECMFDVGSARIDFQSSKSSRRTLRIAFSPSKTVNFHSLDGAMVSMDFFNSSRELQSET